jgi:uncharacterized phage-associated protein
MNTSVLELLKLILQETESESLSIGKTKLIKILYLLEVEYYRSFQKRLTDLEWQFYHYGPYPIGIEKILGSPDLEEMPKLLKDGKVYKKYSVASDRSAERGIDSDVQRLIKRVVNEWGGLGLNDLLDFVYFETEPMRKAKRGEILDFKTIRPWQETKLREIKVDKKKLAVIKRRIIEHTKDLSRPEIKVVVDKDLSEAMKIWDEGKTNVLIRGECIVSPEEFKPKQS